jgi:hypothetical protein
LGIGLLSGITVPILAHRDDPTEGLLERRSQSYRLPGDENAPGYDPKPEFSPGESYTLALFSLDWSGVGHFVQEALGYVPSGYTVQPNFRQASTSSDVATSSISSSDVADRL